MYVRRAFGKWRTFAHTTRAVVSLYQISHVVCSVECGQLPGAVCAAKFPSCECNRLRQWTRRYQIPPTVRCEAWFGFCRWKTLDPVKFTEDSRNASEVYMILGGRGDATWTSEHCSSRLSIRWVTLQYNCILERKGTAVYLHAEYVHRSRSRGPRGLRRGSRAARLLGLRVRIPLGTWKSFSCERHVLSSRGICVGLIPRPEELYRKWRLWMCSRKFEKQAAQAN
jgi:hypothetical protein